MESQNPGRIVIIGAGPVGCVLACILLKRGHRVTVYEKRPDLRRTDLPAGRSINLVLTRRGMHALHLIGLKEDILELTVPVLGRMTHTGGEKSFHPYGMTDEECNYSVSRNTLNAFLLDRAEQAGALMYFDHECLGGELEQGVLYFKTPFGERPVRAELIIGADGAGSVVRRLMVEQQGVQEQIEMLDWGYKELIFPALEDGGYALESFALHIWPQGHHMLMALANLDGSFTGTLYLPFKGADSFEEIGGVEEARALFERAYPSATEVLGDFAEELVGNPVGHLGTVRTTPWHIEDRVLLVGDAAHAIVPFFGQGLNCGFEDCAVLDLILGDHPDDLAGAFKAFDADRRRDANAIADMALENFVEMRDRVADPAFLLRKRVEARMEQTFPEIYRARYAVVTYSSIPYHLAQAIGRIQDAIFEELLQGVEDAEQVDLEQARRLVVKRLSPFMEEHYIGFEF